MTDTLLAVVPIVRTTFDVALASQVIEQVRAALPALGVRVIWSDAPITTLEEAEQTARQFAQQSPDLLLVLQATFADSSMVMAFARQIDAPIVLWAVPEAHTGGRLRLNSLCGINLGAHALRRAGISYHTLYDAPDSELALKKLSVLLKAAYTYRRLRTAKVGRVGEHPVGFDTCAFDAEALKARMGLEIVPIDLREQVFAPSRAVESAAVDAVASELGSRVAGLDSLDSAATRGTLSAYVTLREIAAQQSLDGLAVRCWPEFFTELGCAACGAMSMLSDGGTPCSCEADVNGTITQLMLQWLSGEPAFGSDVVSVDDETDSLVLWHCGLAPLSMADPETTPGVTIHSNRKLPLLMEFSLKPGAVTVARLSEATGEYRLVVGSGEIVRGKKSFSGTTGLLHMRRPARDVLNTILSEGLEHHIAITYGDHADALLTLAQMLNFPVLRLE